MLAFVTETIKIFKIFSKFPLISFKHCKLFKEVLIGDHLSSFELNLLFSRNHSSELFFTKDNDS